MGFPDSSISKESTWNAGDPSSIPGSGRSAGERIGYLFQYPWASLVAQLVKNLPVMWETWVWSLKTKKKKKKIPAVKVTLGNWLACYRVGNRVGIFTWYGVKELAGLGWGGDSEQQLLWGSVSSENDLGAELHICGLGTRPCICDLGGGVHTLIINCVA